MQVNIYQGRATSPQVAEITIVIDVIRAFYCSPLCLFTRCQQYISCRDGRTGISNK